MTFQLTRLMRGVTHPDVRPFYDYYKFQLTRLMRGVTIKSFIIIIKI